MGITTSGNRYEGAKIKKDPVVVMKTGGQASSDLPDMNYSQRVEYIKKKHLPNIVDTGFYFMISETGFDYPMNEEGSDVRKMLMEYYKSKADYTEQSLAENTIYRLEDWEVIRKEIDPETDEEYDTTELEQLSADNTYNFSYLGAIDLDWRVYYDSEYEKYFYVIHPHLGGDIRGNYGEAIILEGDDKQDLFYRFYGDFIGGSASIYLKFKDESELTFHSEQDSDVFYFKFEDDEPAKNSMAHKYLSDFRKFDSWRGDEFLQETIQEFDIEHPKKMSLGGGVSDETPKAYIQILGYPEGKWIDLTDFSDGEEVMEHIYDWMKELNAEKGGNREEYEVHDYEGFGRKLYSEGMGESEFDDIIEGYELYEKSDFPTAIIEEYMNDKSIEEYDDAIEDMNEKYYGSYKYLSDWAYQMVNEGIYTPSISDMYITDTDRRLIASDEADSYVDGLDLDEILEIVGKEDEYKEEKEKLESELIIHEDKLDGIESYMDKAEGDEDLLEKLIDEHNDISDAIDNLKDKIDVIDDLYFEKYKNDANTVIYDRVYDRLGNDLEGFLNEYGYADSITDVSFVNVDYDSIAKELQHDFDVYVDSGHHYVFNSYKGGGKVVRLGKPNPKYKYFVIELGSGKIVSGWEHKSDAQDDQKELKKENPKLSFSVYTRDKAELKFGVDTVTYRDWIKTNELDALSKVAVSASKKKWEDGGMPLRQNEPKSRWDKTKHYARIGAEHTKGAYQDTRDWAVRNDVKGKIKSGFQTAVSKTREGASWLQQQWRDADFGDGKGKAKFFADGGGVEFIEYNGKDIIYEPHYKKYYANDEEFDSLEDAKKYIDSGETPHQIREAYRRGYFKGGGATTKAYDIFDNKRMLLNQANEVEHHAEELNKLAKKKDKVASWVIAKMERATTDLSDVTHYLDGEDKYAGGGDVREIGISDSVMYKGDTWYVTKKNGEIGLVNYSRGAWASDYPFVPLSKVDVEKEVFDMYGNNVTISSSKYTSGGGVSHKYVVYTENEQGYYRKLSEHDTYRGAKIKMDNLWNEGSYDKLGVTTLSDWNNNLLNYIFNYGGELESNEIKEKDEYSLGGELSEKELEARAIEYITGSSIDLSTVHDEANKVAFKYVGNNVWSSLDRKLIDDTIRMHRRSLEMRGRFLNGGTVSKEQKEQNDMCIDVFVDFVTSITNVRYAFTDIHNDKLVFVLEKEPMIDTISDMNEFLHIADDDCSNVFIGDVDYSKDTKVLSVSLKPQAYTEFGNGGAIPEQDKMFHLPLEMVVYVPSTQDVDKVISVDEMDSRVNEVKTYLAEKFGGYSSADKLGGFVDSNGNLVNEDVVQVVSFSTEESFDTNKEELIKQLSKWGKEWGQEAIGFEFEGDLFYVPQEGQVMNKGGDVWIQDAIGKMKSKGTLGAFTKQAKRNKMTTIEFSKEVLKHPKNYQMKTFRRAMFVKNTNPELF